MLTRRYYVAIAKIIAGIEDAPLRERLARTFAALFASDNGRFDRGRFYTACDVREGRAPDDRPCPSEEPTEGYRCTLPAGHDGDHCAHGVYGDIVDAWAREGL